MNRKLQQLWQSFIKNTKNFSGTQINWVNKGSDLGKDIWDCAVPLVLLATPVIAAPLGKAAPKDLLGLNLTAKFIKFIVNNYKEKLLLQEWVMFVSQIAYFESFIMILSISENTNLIHKVSNNYVLDKVQNKIKKLKNLELTEAQAKDVLRCFHNSELAKEFNDILETLLIQVGMNVDEAQLLTKRVAWGTHRYLNKALATVTDSVPALRQLYRDRWRKESDKYHNLDEYLEKQIAEKPQEKVFNESFTFQQIYVSLQVKSVDQNGKVKKNAESVNLEDWAKSLLLDQNKQNQVIFIQGGPGRGKSVFCRIFADLIRRKIHPIWTPILIQLRDISTLENSFQKTLEAAIHTNFVNSDSGWLSDKNTRYLFLLDGFDELLMGGITSRRLQDFLQQVGQFQEDCSRSSEMGHRVLITGRSLALYSIETLLPSNIERVEILPMDDELQQQWFVKWEEIMDARKSLEFQRFLKYENCPEFVQELAQEPLLLYLMVAMHRDEEIEVGFLGGIDFKFKVLIYEKALNLVLNEQRLETLNQKLKDKRIEDLQRIITEAGLCVVQSGGECAAILMIEERLKSDDSAKALLEEAQKHLGESALKNALAMFYLQIGSKEGSVEFCHKSFGEFLCAKRIKENLIDWTRSGIKRQKFYISDKQFDWEIYDLLGYGGLTPEIVEYLTALLTTDGEFRPVELFQRLEDFYLRWSDGEFIDARSENWPQKKMRLLRDQVNSSELGLRQVDIYAGLNVMILLLELNRFAQSQDELKDKVVFYPCGQLDTENFDEFRLLRIIGYCNCIDILTFSKLIASFLSHANLSGANLRDANLSGVNLSRANLSRANLSRANLNRADLSRADLSRADLSGVNLINADLIFADLSGADLNRANLILADLSGADLSRADFSGADLSGADLNRANLILADLSGANLRWVNLRCANLIVADFSRANLSRANLREANLRHTDLRDANLSRANFSRTNLEMVRWDEKTNWENVQGLKTVRNVPEALKQQLGLT
ncbi:MAG: pentapeptide repeat-containing protein [Microcoleus vaginatus WJT46-NPBG5]|jgi:uncharacterized protein YjbI with pentapeptide repeats|nr:pentapeptide repeat-containing protein [Microcoleus vaginatus WJT46-NPBG5]